MMPEEEYLEILEEGKKKLEEYDRRIQYRKLELLGPRANDIAPAFFPARLNNSVPQITSEEAAILRNDKKLADLEYVKKAHADMVEFIARRGDYPAHPGELEELEED